MENYFPVGNNFAGGPLAVNNESFPYFLDLNPYGIKLVIDPSMKSIDSLLTIDILGQAILERGAILINGETYRRGTLLGSGSYGMVYKCKKNSCSEAYAFKILELTDIEAFLKEVIIQILMMKMSENEKNGPHVPRIICVGIDWDNSRGCIISELMENTVQHLLLTNTEAQKEIDVPFVLNQVAYMLEFFGKTLKFNHRDLKADNIMYVRKKGEIHIKLIDFGFSCLTWGSLHISTESYPFVSPCYKEGRDLQQLIYNLYNQEEFNLSDKMYDWLRRLMIVHVSGDDVFLFKNKKIPKAPITHWRNTYGYLNRNNVNTSYTRTKRIRNKAWRYATGQPFHGGSLRGGSLRGGAARRTLKARTHNHQ
jgi:serine/threonine protein kinase